MYFRPFPFDLSLKIEQKLIDLQNFVEMVVNSNGSSARKDVLSEKAEDIQKDLQL